MATSNWDRYMASFKSYPWAIGRYWWIVCIGGIGGIVGLLESIFPSLKVSTLAWVIMFFVGLSVAQFLAWHTIRLERDRWRRFNVTMGILAKIGEYRSQFITHQNAPVRDEVHLGQWMQQFDSLKAEATKYISENINEAEANLFERYGVFPLQVLGGELQIEGRPSRQHIQRKSMIVRDYQFLEELIKDYARPHGWRVEGFFNRTYIPKE